MTEEKLRNRWGIAAAAVVMQICLGAAYGWSVFSKPLVATNHWALTSVQLNFTLAILFLGVGTVIGGLWQDKVGPRRVATVAGILYGISYILAGLSAGQHSLTGMYWTYGVMGGIGMGMGYITPVATLVKWFPDKRGLMTGVAVLRLRCRSPDHEPDCGAHNPVKWRAGNHDRPGHRVLDFGHGCSTVLRQSARRIRTCWMGAEICSAEGGYKD